MIGLTASCLVGVALAVGVSSAVSWRNAYTAAKSANFPVFLSPVHLRDVWWMLMSPLLLPLLRRMPMSWTTPWLSMAQLFDIWQSGHKPFADVGSDTFILATSRGNILWTCDPKICHQLEASYPKVQKAVEMLRFLNIWGPTVASVEGAEWKTHRKVIMSGFTPSTNAKVWQETTKQTKSMIGQWSKQDNLVPRMRDWTNRLTLHVIATVFFRKALVWSDKASSSEPTPVADGFTLSFEQALFTILQRLGVLLITPRMLLGSLPFKRIRETNAAFIDLTNYIQEMIDNAKASLRKSTITKDQSILESIVAAGLSTNDDTNSGQALLPEASVLGNIFFMLSAGHETAGNTMAFTLNLLALYPEYQVRIQEDLDRQRALRPQVDWTVENEYQALQNAWIGAVLKEVLRLYCVVQWLPRVVAAPVTVVDSRGQAHTIPKDTMVAMNFSAAFHNPSTWSRRAMPAERRADLHNSPAADFDPTRWLTKDTAAHSAAASEAKEPIHFPFGQGPYVCPGRLFALVEMTAMLATVLLDYSLELVVDEKTLQSCGGDKTWAWEKTRDQAFRRLVDDIVSNQNIELREELPIRLLKRT